MLAFFHGVEILVFFGASFIGFGLIAGLAAWAFRGPDRPWSVPLVYLCMGIAATTAEYVADSFLGLSVIAASPWSTLIVLVGTFWNGQELDLGWMIIAAVPLNALIIYLIARYRA